MATRGTDSAKDAYEAGKAPPDYYHEKWDGTRWLKLRIPGLFYCWLADGMPTTQQALNHTKH